MTETPCSIPVALRAAVERHGAAPLVVTPDRTHDLTEIDDASGALAAGLVDAGIGPGQRVALYCPNVVEFVIAYLGIIKAGAVVVPVNLLIQPAEILYMLDDAEVAAVVYHAMLAEKAAAVRQRLARPLCWVCIGERPIGPDDLDFSTLASTASRVDPPPIDPLEDLAAILYTSGTTGYPKGAMLTHHNLVSNAASVAQALHLRPGQDRLLVVLPMFHSFAATVGLLTPALHGLALVPVVGFEPVALSEVVARTAPTVFLGVPSMYNLILRIDDRLVSNWASVRFGVAGGAAMPVALLQQFEARFGFPIIEGDGPTECSPVTCVNPLDGARKPGSVGLPVPDVAIAILDDRGAPLSSGEIGEVCVRGPNVMKGYWRLPEATAETIQHGWLRTGDLGYLDEDGYLFLVDRKKDMVIVNGMNVYPRMVEEVLYRHPAVLEAAVVGEPHPTHGEIVVAYLVARPATTLRDGELRAFCRERLGPHQMPRRFVLRDSLPKNATGKIMKRELRRTGEVERGIEPDMR